ncbi:MAG: peptidase M23 [Bacteroidetes bacterium HGW-Bacteroidetes-11]|jgi:murein DD-endopeptidase MepM/ murein hydrolase activator NlpD|nr:MAG: peptidase M23 [Bacteroidetes bacterium HGW-Bacteroidetes-11]
MAKVRYHFNTSSLKIEKVKITFRQRFLSFLSVFFTGLVFAALVLVLAYNFLDSPKERMMRREIDHYKLQYAMLNDRLDQVQAVVADLQQRDDNIYRVIFESEPIPSSVRKAGYGGADRYARMEGYKNSEIIINTTRKLDQITSQLYVQSKSFDEVFNLAKRKEELLAAIPAIQPVANKDLRRIGSYFGYRTDPFYKVTKFHEGIDFTATVGTDIYATGDGTVASIEYSRRGYGNMVIISHGFGYETVYAHMSKMNVKPGQKVKRGQVIGHVGNTGKSTSPHLHYEVRKNGLPVDPINFFFNDITPEEYALMIEQSERPSQALD